MAVLVLFIYYAGRAAASAGSAAIYGEVLPCRLVTLRCMAAVLTWVAGPKSKSKSKGSAAKSPAVAAEGATPKVRGGGGWEMKEDGRRGGGRGSAGRGCALL
eukprot:3016349-Rhodomonas_salina.1